MKNVVIVSAVRTPIGAFGGSLSSIPAVKLGAAAISGAVAAADIKPEEVDEVIMGMVLQGGTGQAPARQAAIYGDIPASVPCMTVHKVCGSGLKAVMLAAQQIQLGDADIVVAGGMESMSNVPYYLLNARTGYRLGDGKLVDGVIYDGLWDPYDDMHMGMCGELCAEAHSFDRKSQDEYAIESYKRAQTATAEGWFDNEIISIEVPQRKGDPSIVAEDEEPSKARFDKIPTLRPAFIKDGTITAANASKINDGAAALVLMAESVARDRGLTPLARLHGRGTFSQEPQLFTTSPATAIRRAISNSTMPDGSSLNLDDIDLFEINEAFAVVAQANMKLLDINSERVNVNGGAVALGHPLGASGARILTTLVHALINREKIWGVAGICLGGGEAVAQVIERI